MVKLRGREEEWGLPLWSAGKGRISEEENWVWVEKGAGIFGREKEGSWVS